MLGPNALPGAGALDQRLTIEVPATQQDEMGQDALTWDTDAVIWAHVMETPGREFLKGDYRAEERAVFVARWRPIDSTARVIWGGRTWRIDNVTGTRRVGFCWLQCTSTDGKN